MSAEQTAHDFFNMAAPQIDLSQAHSLRTIYDNGGDAGHAETTGNPHIAEFKRVLEEVLAGLTDATQKTIGSQTQYFDITIKEFMTGVQEALNDIDGRLNALSRQQAVVEDTLDAFIKFWMFNDTGANLDDQRAIIANFLKRGMPQVETANDHTASADVEA
jgi:hypothetical protein